MGYYRKPKTTGERRTKSGERADFGRTPPTKGRRRDAPDARSLEPLNEKRARQWKLLRKWIAHHVRKGTPKAEALPLFLEKREFRGMDRGYFYLFWGWAVEDARPQKTKKRGA